MIDKICSTCGGRRPIAEFSSNNKFPDGLSKTCDGCKLLATQYYQEHKEQASLRAKANYQLNKGEKIQKASKYYHANKEKAAAASKIYRDNNKEVIRARKQAYTQKQKELKNSLKEVLPEDHKRCRKCNDVKHFREFDQPLNGDFERVRRCTACKLNAQRVWDQENPEKRKKYSKNYWKRNPDKLKVKKSRYGKSASGRAAKARQFIRNKANPVKYFKMKLTNRFHDVFRQHPREESSTLEEAIQCTIPFLAEHLKSTLPSERVWEEFINGDLELDHQIPVRLAETREEIILCWHYSNLTLIDWRDNTTKRDLLPDGKYAHKLALEERKERLKLYFSESGHLKEEYKNWYFNHKKV